MSAIIYSAAIGPVPIDCVINEKHESTITITENPIETGSKVHDHAYIEPKRINLELADGEAAASFNALVRFQESRVPFVLVTGLSVFPNMLVKAITAERDKDKAYILSATVELQEIIIVGTAYAAGTEGSADAGEPGGRNSTRAARPSPERSPITDPDTVDRTTGVVQRGDDPTISTPSTSVLRGVFQ